MLYSFDCKLNNNHSVETVVEESDIVSRPFLASHHEQLPCLVVCYPVQHVLPICVRVFRRILDHQSLLNLHHNPPFLYADLHYLLRQPNVSIDKLLTILAHPFQLIDRSDRLALLAENGKRLKYLQIFINNKELVAACADEDMGSVVSHSPAFASSPRQSRQDLRIITGIIPKDYLFSPSQDVYDLVGGEEDAALKEVLLVEDGGSVDLSKRGLVLIGEGVGQDMEE